jgi:hypothetical protein
MTSSPNRLADSAFEPREVVLHLAERLCAEGWPVGYAKLWAEGYVKGWIKGRTEVRIETLVQQLTLKFGALPTWVTETISTADAAQLRIWIGRVLMANHLDDIFTR